MIGDNILRIRKENKKSRKWLSDVTGISEMSIRRYESNERTPSAEQALAIANAFGLGINDIVKSDPDAIDLGSTVGFSEPDPDDPENTRAFTADSRTITGKALNVLTGLKEQAYQDTWIQMGEDLIDLRNKLKEK